MKTLTIGTKAQAQRASTESLFHSGGTATKCVKWCTGKYSEAIKGTITEVPDKVIAMWPERRKDSEGPYWTLYAFVKG